MMTLCIIINNIKILYCDTIDASEGIDVRTSASKESNTCHYYLPFTLTFN